MKIKTKLLGFKVAVAALFISLSSMNATPTDTAFVYEDFSFAASPIAVGNPSEGFGWTGDWTKSGNGAIEIDLVNSLAYPTGAGIVASAGSITKTSSTGASMARSLENTLALSANTFYVSFLAQKNAAGNFRLEGYGGANKRYGMRVYADGSVELTASTTTDVTSAGVFEDDVTYLVVVKHASATNSVVLFKEGDAIPSDDSGVTWALTHTNATGVALDKFSFAISSNIVKLDEFLVGSSWKSVTTDGPATLAYKAAQVPQPTIYEGFEGSTLDVTTDSLGFGWMGKWSYDSEVTSGVDASDDHIVVTTPDNKGYGINRDLAVALPLGTSQSVYYTSFLAQKDATGDFHISGHRASDGIVRYSINIDADGKLGLQAAATSATRSDISLFANNTPYFVVTKYWYEGNAGHMQIKLFEDGDDISEPGAGTWDFEVVGATTGLSIDYFRFAFSAEKVWLDEFKVGASWETVTADEVDFDTFVTIPTALSAQQVSDVKVQLSRDASVLNVMNYNGAATIYNITGKRVLSVNDATLPIDVASMQRGIYILSTESGAIKFVK